MKNTNKAKPVNLGFKRAVKQLKVEGVSELLEITEDAVYKILRGDNQLKLAHAAKLYEATRVGWNAFKEFV